jgi:hypothetical protein
MRPLHHERFYGTILSLVFSVAYTLFQVTYLVSPLLAALMRILHPERFYGTKTAGCIPTIPILERAQPQAPEAAHKGSTLPALWTPRSRPWR